jgi:hypothetical protein
VPFIYHPKELWSRLGMFFASSNFMMTAGPLGSLAGSTRAFFGVTIVRSSPQLGHIS